MTSELQPQAGPPVRALSTMWSQGNFPSENGAGDDMSAFAWTGLHVFGGGGFGVVNHNAGFSVYEYMTLPYESNYLDLDPTVRDPLGLPVIRITGAYKENELRIAAFLQGKMEQWYREAGAIEVSRGGLGSTMGVSTHAYGGTRMGDDPETNVVDRWGFSHEAPNLGVLGASERHI